MSPGDSPIPPGDTGRGVSGPNSFASRAAEAPLSTPCSEVPRPNPSAPGKALNRAVAQRVSSVSSGRFAADGSSPGAMAQADR